MSKEESVEKVLLRPVEVGQALGMSRSKIYELISSGEIPSVKVAGCVRIPAQAFRTWVDGQLKDNSRR